MIGARNGRMVCRAVPLALLMAAGIADATDEVPHDARGHESSGYQLSEYENINLANGNLTFTIPLARVATDGGLDYQLALRHNAKVFFTSRYCSIVPQGYQDCADAGGELLEVQIAHGVSSFGFGWDLRPPRVVPYRQLPVQRRMALVDDTGARHLLYLNPPWVDAEGAGEAGAGEASVGDRHYTKDGTNFRFTVTAVDGSGRAVAMELEDGSGTVFVFAHVVPTACDMDRAVGLDDQDLGEFNFRVETSGLYLSEIRRGPWRADGSPANRIAFDYRGQAAGWDDPCGGPGTEQWLPTRVTAHGEVPRELLISYDPATSAVSSIEVPAFDPVIGHHGPSGQWEEIELDVSSESFEQRNGAATLSFEAPHLERVRFPNGATFELDSLLSSGRPPLSDVVLPSGARVVYGRGWYPIGKGRCLNNFGESDPPCRVWATCGATIPRPGLSLTAELATKGIAWRDVEYLDGSTEGGPPRVETTWFVQGLNCAVDPAFTKPPNELHPWPYDFDWALRDDHGTLRPEYLWTVVYSFANNGGPEERPSVEIHRFHPLTREEFSVDYLAGGDDELAVLPLTAMASGAEDLRGAGVRVLRHVEIERELRFGLDWPAITDRDRYGWVRETRTFTDETVGAASADVEACYEPVFADPLGPTEVTIDCTEVRDTRDVDTYLNPISRSLVSERSAAGVEAARDWSLQYLDDGAEADWFLHRELASQACEGGGCSRRSTTWTDLSDSAARAFWAPEREVLNPGAGGGCSSDCVETSLVYDTAGNIEASTVRGGYGTGFGELQLTTRTEHRHGVPVRKQLEAPGGSLLLWQREADPGTGLARWHLSGSGAGHAYLWDATGRLTDLAPIEGDLVAGEWRLALQQADDGSTMLGRHLDYLYPAGGQLLRHQLREASYALQGGSQRWLVRTWMDQEPEQEIAFDGRGRLTHRSERYPGGSGRRSRLELDLLDDGSTACGIAPGGSSDGVTRISLASEWRDDAQWSSCDDLDWTQTRYDGLGRPARIELPDGSVSEIGWLGDSQQIRLRRVVTSTDRSQEQVATFTLTDALGRLRVLEEETAPGERVLADLRWDVEDRLVDARLWQGAPYQSAEQRRQFTYTPAGFLAVSSEPERTVTYTGYDAGGNLRESHTGGIVTRRWYDHLGRLVGRYTDGLVAARWIWGDDDPGSSAWPGEPSYGRIVRAVGHNRFGQDDVGVVSAWRYEGPGARISQKTVTIDGVGPIGDGFVTRYDYDRKGLVAAVQHPTWDGWDPVCQEPVVERRNRLGDWLVAADLAVGPAESSVAGIERSYLASGRVGDTGFLVAQSSSGGLEETPDPDGMARPAGYRLWWNGPGTLWSEGPYAYDGSGNVASIGNRDHAYDGLDRLVALDHGAPVARYEYDRWGNLTEIRDFESGPGGGFTLRLPGAGGDNRPDAVEVVGHGIVPLSWDARGNLSSMPTTLASRAKAFRYSPDDRLQESVDVATGTTLRFAYDAAGERVLSWRRDAGGQLAEVLIDLRDEDGAVLSDWLLLPGASFAPTTDYLRADGRMAIQLDHAAGGLVPLFAAHDHLGSTRALVAADGTLTDVIDYLPYGRLRGGGPVPSTNHLFTGHQRDLGVTTSELDYMHARHYSPLLGRFVSIDTVGGNPSSSQSWNRYAYTSGNPLRAIDPDGRYERDVHSNLTYYLALKAGWSHGDAESIARANQGVDDRTGANPLKPWNFALHFGSLADAMVHVDAARSPAQLGAALHSVQDSFSHEGYGWPFGHGHMNVLGRSPDDPWRDVPKAMEMAETSFEVLGGDLEDLDREFLDVLFRTESKEERIRMLEDAVSCPGEGIPAVVGITPADELHERLIRDYYLRNGYDLRTE